MKKLELEKINELLLKEYNVFYTYQLLGAIQDEEVSMDRFRYLCSAFASAEANDDNSWVPRNFNSKSIAITGIKMTPEEADKVNCFLKLVYNLFHADLITRVIQNDRITAKQFKVACGVIAMAESMDNDEFVPKGWEDV